MQIHTHTHTNTHIHTERQTCRAIPTLRWALACMGVGSDQSDPVTEGTHSEGVLVPTRENIPDIAHPPPWPTLSLSPSISLSQWPSILHSGITPLSLFSAKLLPSSLFLSFFHSFSPSLSFTPPFACVKTVGFHLKT